MKIAIVTSNVEPLDRTTTKGTENFLSLFLEGLHQSAAAGSNQYTVFASGDSKVPFPLVSVTDTATSRDPEIEQHGKHMIFELALLSKAFSMQDQFDLYHIHIGDGDIALPFLPFLKKPVLITLHHFNDVEFTREYFSLFHPYPNVGFISISNYQRVMLPGVNYIKTIYHGIEIDQYQYSASGGEAMMWAGRGVPDKGVDFAVDVAVDVKKDLHLFAIHKPEYRDWFELNVQKKVDHSSIVIIFNNTVRADLIPQFQQSKLFLFPIRYEESFGLVLIESMACGTPVVAFARGSIPEIVEDGVTGFLVNPSADDIRGDYVIKEVGLEGIKKAIEKVYALSSNEYRSMRLACRKRVEKEFSVQRMVKEYEDVYAAMGSK